HGPASAARAGRVPRLQGQRRGGSARWVEKEDVLAMRWAWVDQGTRRPIGGQPCAFGVDVRQPQPGAHRTKSAWSPLLIEQETKEDGLIRRALSSLFDRGCVKTPKGRSRRGIVFYQRCGFPAVLHPSRTYGGWSRTSFYV